MELSITPTGKNKALSHRRYDWVAEKMEHRLEETAVPHQSFPCILRHIKSERYRRRRTLPSDISDRACHMQQAGGDEGYPEMMANFKVFEVAPYGRLGTEDILKGAIPIFEHSDVVLLGNHGVLAVEARWKMR